ncbi:hypothetical protein B0H14DRAFT_3539719 [Mycena olivaceomarginata]|nr:hypothetical protein B0H14DRAFT_3539719 [Mycena olivaceomarginata]
MSQTLIQISPHEISSSTRHDHEGFALPPSLPECVQGLLQETISVDMAKKRTLRPSAHETAVMAYLRADVPTSSDIDPTTLPMPPTSVIREIVQALRHASPAVIYRSIRCAHIPGKKDTYPLWIISYWAELRPILEARQRWDSAVHALETRIQRNTSDFLGPQILDRILAMPWYSSLRGFQESDPEGVIGLCKPTAWLKTTEIDQMLELLTNNAELSCIWVGCGTTTKTAPMSRSWDELRHTPLPNPPLPYMYSGLAPNEDVPDNRANTSLAEVADA